MTTDPMIASVRDIAFAAQRRSADIHAMRNAPRPMTQLEALDWMVKGIPTELVVDAARRRSIDPDIYPFNFADTAMIPSGDRGWRVWDVSLNDSALSSPLSGDDGNPDEAGPVFAARGDVAKHGLLYGSGGCFYVADLDAFLDEIEPKRQHYAGQPSKFSAITAVETLSESAQDFTHQWGGADGATRRTLQLRILNVVIDRRLADLGLDVESLADRYVVPTVLVDFSDRPCLREACVQIPGGAR